MFPPTPRIAALIAAIVVTLAACGDDDSDATISPITTAATPATETTAAAPTTEPSRPGHTATVTVIAIEVADGEVVGGAGESEVPLGATLRIQVTADVEDEVHVHGYDVLAPIEDGVATIELVADIPGQFEVELEGSGLLLVELTVA